jgi:hypothetical protein
MRKKTKSRPSEKNMTPMNLYVIRFECFFIIIFLLLIKQEEGPSIGMQTSFLTSEQIEVNYELLNN